MYLFLCWQSSGDVINLIVFIYLFIYFIKIQKEKNVFDRREYIKALKKSKNKSLDCKGHCVSTVQQCKKIACFDL